MLQICVNSPVLSSVTIRSMENFEVDKFPKFFVPFGLKLQKIRNKAARGIALTILAAINKSEPATKRSEHWEFKVPEAYRRD